MNTHEKLRKAQQTLVNKLMNPARYEIDYTRDVSSQYKRLVHNVNLRIDKLRELSKEEGFKGITKWSMQKLQYEAGLHGYLTEKGRISSVVPTSKREFNKRLKELQTFLTAPTSTRAGIMEIYQKRADTINKRYGTNFDWQDLGKYFESGLSEKYDTKYGSKTALKSIGQIQKNAEQIKKQVEQHKKKMIIAEDSELQSTVDELLKDKGLTRLKLY